VESELAVRIIENREFTKDFIPLLISGFLEAAVLKNYIPVLILLARLIDSDALLNLIYKSAPFFPLDSCFIPYVICIRWLAQFGVDVHPVREKEMRLVKDYTFEFCNPVNENVPTVLQCLERLPAAFLDAIDLDFIQELRSKAPNLEHAAASALPMVVSDYGNIKCFIEQRSLSTLWFSLKTNTKSLKESLHPFWNEICMSIRAIEDPEFQIAVFNLFSDALNISTNDLVHSLRKFLVPLCINSLSLQEALSRVFGSTFEVLLVEGIETWMVDILSPKHKSEDWESHILDLKERFPSLKSKTLKDLVSAGGINLVVQLCLIQHQHGIEWVQKQSKDKRFPILDIFLASLIELSDSLVHDRWGPQRLDPIASLMSLNWLIEYVGERVSIMASQLVSLLCSLIEEYRDCVLSCMSTFMSVANETTKKRFWACMVTSSVRGIRESASTPTVNFLKYMFSIATNEILLDCPDIPQDVQELKPFQNSIRIAKCKLQLAQTLGKLCQRMKSTEVHVAEASIAELLALLGQNASDVYKYYSPNTMLESLVDVAENHASLIPLVSECIGAFGILDNWNVHELCNSHSLINDKLILKEKSKTEVFLDSKHLCVHLFKTYLVPHFHSCPSYLGQTLIAYSIQEVFKLFKADCLSVLDDFDSLTVRHLLTSKYRVLDGKRVSPYATDDHSFPEIIFVPGMEYSVWICEFLLELLPHCSDEMLSKVLSAIKPLILKARNHKVASCALPFVVVHICQSSQEAVHFIARECVNVLNHVEYSIKEFCIFVFQLLSYLNSWRRNSSVSDRDKRIRRIANTSCDFIQLLLEEIPARLLAKAAEKIEYFEFASYFLETAPFDSTEQLLNIYLKQNEEDYVSGTLRTLDLAPQEAIASLGHTPDFFSKEFVPNRLALQHAFSGDWSCVQAVYEAAVHDSPNDLACHIRLYSSMKELGYFRGLLDQCNGALQRHPDWHDEVNPIRLEACWKLGQWELLEQFSTPSSSLALQGSSETYARGFQNESGLVQMSNGRANSLGECDMKTFDLGELFRLLCTNSIADFHEKVNCHRKNAFIRFQQNHASKEIVEFHVLHDISQAANSLLQGGCLHSSMPTQSTLEHMLDEWYASWKTRYSRSPSSHAVREEIIHVGRAILQLFARKYGIKESRESIDWESNNSPYFRWNTLMGHLWHESAKVAMKESRPHAAYANLLRALPFVNCAKGASVSSINSSPHIGQLDLDHERLMCKWISRNRSKHEALIRLRSVSLLNEKLSPDAFAMQVEYNYSIDKNSDSGKRARLQLLQARWMEETGDSHSEIIFSMFRSVCASQPKYDVLGCYSARGGVFS
jgi:hypothetical protein